MKKSIRKVILTCILVGTLGCTNIICFAASKSFNTKFSFSGTVFGKVRKYDFGDITVTTKSKQKTWGTLYDNKFTVSLYYSGLIWDTYIGKYKAKCEGTTKDGWTNIPGGKYRIELNKNKRDGQLLEGTMKIVNSNKF